MNNLEAKKIHSEGMLERLTIVIPTYNRLRYMLRALEFWYKTPVQLVILDGSAEPTELPDKFKASENITYYHGPVSLMERLGKSTEFIKTRYAALISDDEFFLPSVLTKCIQFLDENEDYAACKGLAVSFGWDGRIINWRPINKTLRGYKVEAENPSDRIYEHLSNYAHASLWSVQRRDVYAASMKAVGSGPSFAAGTCYEVQVALITSYMGKIKVFDDLMWLRSYENKSIAWEQMPLSIREWWRDSAYESQHKRLINSVLTYAEEYCNHSPSYQEVESALEAHIQRAEERLRLGVIKRKEQKRRKLFNLYVFINKYGKIILNNTIFYKSGYKGYSLLSHVHQAYPAKYHEVKEIAGMIYKYHKVKY
ncbi:TIGR00180 family glycosyltransferase [Flagellimonas marinaquae]